MRVETPLATRHDKARPGAIGHEVRQDNEGKPISFENWSDGEPNDYMRKEDVAVVHTETGLWNDIGADKVSRTLCVFYP